MRRKTHFCGGEWELWYMIRVYKAHTLVPWSTRILYTYIYTIMRVWCICIRANKSDRNLTDQISGQSFDDHVEQFNSQSPTPPPFRHDAISLAVDCVSLDFSLPLSVLQSNLWSQLLTVTIVLYTSTLVSESGVRSLPLNDRSSAGGCTGGYVQNP